MESRLIEISEKLSELINSQDDKVTIEYQTNTDKSIIVGTRDGILNFTKSLIDSLIEVEKNQNIEFNESNLIKRSIDALGSVSIDWLIVVKDSTEKEAILKPYRDT